MIAPDPELFVENSQKSFGVFFVEQALGSHYIPGQSDFVIPYGVRSVLGFGGVLAQGEVFTVIALNRVPVTREIANR